jgi:hypothetical protein
LSERIQADIPEKYIALRTDEDADDIELEVSIALDADETTSVTAIVNTHSSTPDLVEYKRIKKLEVDEVSATFFWTGLTGVNDSIATRMYKMLAHMFKSMEAHDNKNDREGDDSKRQPTAYKKNAGGNRIWKILEREATKRGNLTLEQLADIVEPLAEAQWDLMSEVEGIRPVTKDAISAAADFAAVDALMVQFYTDLDALAQVL